ncbi:PAS domain-containing protein [Ovoidimarina sediminis]|uniref:PAS domain-containing protein n=1 Tax=Ovoidimarina sediminis TaxID=3079856 RepID=UPI00290B6957|nr:PAS domain-containing protein [Rhodophyticola sp. MJ-SS7]MDU8945142.1 HAMP domain-containing protein [Rhodophyticola sp. MJ-SS7]
MFNNISIGVKLPLVIVLIGLISILGAEAIATANTRATIMVTGEDRLLAVAESRATEVRRELDAIRADLKGMRENPVILDAARAFVTAWQLHGPDARDELRRLYLDDNPNPQSQRLQFNGADDRSAYSLVHLRYHRFFRAKTQAQRYKDILLIAPDGRIVYSVAKTEEFGTDIDDFPVGQAGLVRAVRLVQGGTMDEVMTEFLIDPAAPGSRSAIFALPVTSPFGTVEAVLAVRVSITRIDEIMQRPAGLGRTGEAFLTDAYSGRISVLRRVAPALTGRIPAPDAERRNLGRGRQIIVQEGPNGAGIVSAHVPLDILGRYFGVYVQQARGEILAPAEVLRDKMLVEGAMVLSLVTIFGVLLARGISRPLLRVDEAMGLVASRDYLADIPDRRRNDEIGQIARRLDSFRATLLEAESYEREIAFKGAAFEQSPAALMLVDANLTIIYVNARMIAFLRAHRIALDRHVPDFTPELSIGRPLELLFPGSRSVRGRLEEAELVTEHLQLGSAHLQIDCGLIRDSLREVVGMLLSWTDITDRQKQNALSQVLETQTPLASFSPDGRLVEMNAPFRALAGPDRSLVLGTHWDHILSAWPEEPDAPQFTDWADLKSGLNGDAAFRIAPKGGQDADTARVALHRVRDIDGRLQSLILVFVPERKPSWSLVSPDLGPAWPYAAGEGRT